MTKMDSRDVRRDFRRYWKQCCERDPRLKTDAPAKRFEFSAYVDGLARGGYISDGVAQRVTLDGD